MKHAFTVLKSTFCLAISASLIACGSGSSSNTTAAPGNNGGLDCFADGATVANTTEGSGIALFFNAIIYPSNTNTGTPWTFLLPAALDLKGTPNYNYTTCAAKYDTIINTVIAQDRNRNGTFNEGSNDTYAALRSAVATSTAPFVGLDTFYWAADNLGLSGNTTSLTASAFKSALDTKCAGTVGGLNDNLNTTGVCPNGTYMHNFLWRKDGLFTNNGNANFVGVQPSGGNPGLTWTRGYLLKAYSNRPSVEPGVWTAVFDAGSSGTRVSLYHVTPGPKAVVTLQGKTISYKKGDSGINDFMAGNGWIDPNSFTNKVVPPGCSGTTNLGQDQVGPCVLQPLLDDVTNLLGVDVPTAQVKVELFATAGMRTEEIKNGGAFTSAEIANFYSKMKQYVSSTPIGDGVVYSNVGQFKTINGNSEEGVWSWINLNDVYYDTFSTYGSCGNNQIGDFEVGGSSMQVAFPTNAVASDAANIYNVNINGCSINVYSKTFLGLGGDDARKFMRAYNY